MPRALLVEENLGIQELIRTLLKTIDINTDIVGSDSDALLQMQRRNYNLVIVDLGLRPARLPESVRHIIQRRPDLRERLILVSAASEKEVAKALGEDLVHFRVLRKPFEIAELLGTASEIIDQPRNRAAARAEDLGAAYSGRFSEDCIRLGAAAAALVAWSGDFLDPACVHGYQFGQVELYFPLLDHQSPMWMSVEGGNPVWVGSRKMASADHAMLVPLWKKSKSHAMAAVPIRREKRVVGAGAWSFRKPQKFGPEQREEIEGVARAYTDLLCEILDDSSGKNNGGVAV